ARGKGGAACDYRIQVEHYFYDKIDSSNWEFRVSPFVIDEPGVSNDGDAPARLAGTWADRYTAASGGESWEKVRAYRELKEDGLRCPALRTSNLIFNRQPKDAVP